MTTEPKGSEREVVRHYLVPSGPGGWSFCSCGFKTGPVGTFKAKRAWHKQHKLDAAQRINAEPER